MFNKVKHYLILLFFIRCSLILRHPVSVPCWGPFSSPKVFWVETLKQIFHQKDYETHRGWYKNLKVIKNTLPDKLGNPESLKKWSHQFKSSSTNVLIVSKDLLKAFYKLFYLQFCDSSDLQAFSINAFYCKLEFWI